MKLIFIWHERGGDEIEIGKKYDTKKIYKIQL